MNLLERYLLSLFLTFFIEFIIIYLFIRKDPLKLLYYSLIINSFTLPIATNLYLNYSNNFWLIEIAVVLLESLLLKWLLEIRFQRSLQISLIANLITAMISFLFFI